jgi:hypothetical protein
MYAQARYAREHCAGLAVIDARNNRLRGCRLESNQNNGAPWVRAYSARPGARYVAPLTARISRGAWRKGRHHARRAAAYGRLFPVILTRLTGRLSHVPVGSYNLNRHCPVAVHWQGNAWRETDLPAGLDSSLSAASADSASDAWATCQDGSCVLHRNASSWTVARQQVTTSARRSHPRMGRASAPMLQTLSGRDGPRYFGSGLGRSRAHRHALWLAGAEPLLWSRCCGCSGWSALGQWMAAVNTEIRSLEGEPGGSRGGARGGSGEHHEGNRL